MSGSFAPVPLEDFEPGSMGQISQATWANFICRSRYPVVAFFHIFFKVRA